MLTSDRITETDILDGRWDNAAVEVWRVNWGATRQRVLMRRGAHRPDQARRLAFVAEVRILAHVLGQTVGRTFQAYLRCGAGRCALWGQRRRPRFQGHGRGHGSASDRGFTASGLGGFEAGWFTSGTIDWTSGANAGRQAEVAGA